MELSWDGEVVVWRGPAPFLWVPVPETLCEDVRDAARVASYGWGAVPVEVTVGETRWETSLLPKDGGYLVPLKAVVRQREGIDAGDAVTVAMRIATRGGRRANGNGPTC